MGLITWIRGLFDGQYKTTEIDYDDFFNIASELYIRNLAFESGVNLIANAISKCEFKTYVKGVEKKGREYYLWNVEPNLNQNSSEFIHKMISKLYKENECLIISQGEQMLVADSFNVKEYALYGNQFTNVTVKDFQFAKTFNMADVLYLKLNNDDIRRLINGMYETYGKMITYAQTNFNQSRGRKGILNVSAIAQGKENFKETFDKLMNERFKKYFENNNAVLPLFDGYDYKENESKTYSADSTRDIKAMIDDIYDITARALRIPPALLKGDLANVGTAVDNFLTFGIDPLTDMIQEEANRKRSGYEAYSSGTYLQIDTKTIKHIDLLSVATAVDKLISSGAFCINDIRKAVGDTIIDEPWAWQHFITKNYSTVEDILNALGDTGGKGVNNEEKNVGT